MRVLRLPPRMIPGGIEGVDVEGLMGVARPVRYHASRNAVGFGAQSDLTQPRRGMAYLGVFDRRPIPPSFCEVIDGN